MDESFHHSFLEISITPSAEPQEIREYVNTRAAMEFNSVLRTFLCGFFIVMLSLQTVTSQEVEDEREFNYDVGSETGPEKWGEMHEEWAACKGNMQSPVDLLNKRVQVVSHLGRLNRSYKPSNATLLNRGHDIMMKWAEGAGVLRINGTEYELQQCHWHHPSEHTIDGERFELEAHLVHQSPDGKIAVIGILYKLGRPDSFLSMLKNKLALINETHEEIVAGVINPRGIKIGSRKYYRYNGSLTVPPCTEGVVWTIVHKVRTVSREQLDLLHVAVHDEADTNARPLQAMNKRKVYFYRPDDRT